MKGKNPTAWVTLGEHRGECSSKHKPNFSRGPLHPRAVFSLQAQSNASYRTLDYVRCRHFLKSRPAADEQVRNIKIFVANWANWASLVFATDTPITRTTNEPWTA